MLVAGPPWVRYMCLIDENSGVDNLPSDGRNRVTLMVQSYSWSTIDDVSYLGRQASDGGTRDGP